MKIHGLPTGTEWPGRIPPPDKYDELRQDAQRLAREHRADVTSVVEDARLQLRCVEPASVGVMRNLLAASGLPVPEGMQPQGVFGARFDGGYEIQLGEHLNASDLKRTLLHEIGHLRAHQLMGDLSEIAAEAWREAFEGA